MYFGGSCDENFIKLSGLSHGLGNEGETFNGKEVLYASRRERCLLRLKYILVLPLARVHNTQYSHFQLSTCWVVDVCYTFSFPPRLKVTLCDNLGQDKLFVVDESGADASIRISYKDFAKNIYGGFRGEVCFF